MEIGMRMRKSTTSFQTIDSKNVTKNDIEKESEASLLEINSSEQNTITSPLQSEQRKNLDNLIFGIISKEEKVFSGGVSDLKIKERLLQDGSDHLVNWALKKISGPGK